MKKLIAVILVMLMVLGMVACGASEGAADTGATPAATKDPNALAEGQLLVGYGRTNITPEDSVPLSGYGNTSRRMSSGFMDYLYATCFAVTDADGNTAILFGIDMTNSGNTLYTTAREKISKKYNIPIDRKSVV